MDVGRRGTFVALGDPPATPARNGNGTFVGAVRCGLLVARSAQLARYATTFWLVEIRDLLNPPPHTAGAALTNPFGNCPFATKTNPEVVLRSAE